MAMKSFDTLLEICRNKENWSKTIVIKNLAAVVNPETLGFYMEVVLDVKEEELNRLYLPTCCPGLAVACFERNIQESEVDKWREAIGKRPLEGTTPTINLLGSAPSGVYVRGVPENVTDEFLSLFFESRKKSGGDEDTVIAVDHIAGDVHAAIYINDTTAIRSILNFHQPHVMKGRPIQVEPFFSNLHPVIIRQLQETADAETGNSDNQAHWAQPEMPPIQQNRFEPTGPNSPQMLSRSSSYQTVYERTPNPPQAGASPIDMNREIPSLFDIEVTPVHCQPLNAPPPQAKGPVRRSQFSDRKMDNSNGRGSGTKTPMFKMPFQGAGDGRQGPLHGYQDDQGPNMNSGPVMHQQRRPSTSNRNDKKNGATSNRAQAQRPTKEDKPFNHTETLTSDKVLLLVMGQFGRENNSPTVEVILNVKEGNVKIYATTREEMTAILLKMFELLEKVVKMSKLKSANICKFLARGECKACMRKKLKDNGLKVIVEADCASNVVLFHGFSQQVLDDASQLLDNCLVVIDSKIELSKLNIAQTAVSTLKCGQLTQMGIASDGTRLEIIGLYRDRVEEARKMFWDYLERNAPKTIASFELEDAQAKCFKRLCDQELKEEFGHRGAKLEVEILGMSASAEKIRFCLTGSQDDIDLFQKAKSNIWHGWIDFKKLSQKEEDQWLIMKGLQNVECGELVKICGEPFNSFLQMSKHGQLSPPPQAHVRITQEETVVVGASSVSSDDESDGNNTYQISDDDEPLITFDPVNRPARRANMQTDKYKHLQGHMTDDEALALALSKSEMESSGDYDVYGNVSNSQDSLPDFENFARLHDDNMLMFSPPRYQSNQYQSRQFPSALMKEYSSGDQFPSALSKEYSSGDRMVSVQMSGVTIQLTRGSVADYQADALVDVVSPTFAQNGVISKAFLQRGGTPNVDQLSRQAVTQGPTSLISTTKPVTSQLRCKFLYHLNLGKSTDQNQSIRDAIRNILAACANDNCSCVALPPLGVGRMYNYAADASATETLHALHIFCQQARAMGIYDGQAMGIYDGQPRSTTPIQAVTIVVFDAATFDVFKNAVDNFKKHPMQPGQWTNPAVRQNVLHRPSPALQPSQTAQLFPQQNQPQPYSMFGQVRAPHFPAANPTGNAFGNAPSVQARNLYPRRNDGARQDRPGAQRRGGTASGAQRSRDSGDRVGGRRRHHHSADSYTREKSSTDSRSTGDRDDGRARKTPKPKHASLYPPEQALDKIQIMLYNEKKAAGLRDLKHLARSMRTEFLHEEKYNKKKISRDTKDKIARVVRKHNIKSVKEKDHFTLKGRKLRVSEAHKEILVLLLSDTSTAAEGEPRQQRRQQPRRGTREFVTYMTKEEPRTPAHWSNFKPGNLIQDVMHEFKAFFTNTKYKKVDIPADSRIFSTIIKMINATFDKAVIGKGVDAVGLDRLGYSKLIVTKIQRIENPDLYRDYFYKRTKLFHDLTRESMGRWPAVQDLPGSSGAIKTEQYLTSDINKDRHPEINEVFAFHGTPDKKVAVKICNEGLDHNVGSYKAMFGRGVYGAEMASKADQYADDKDNRTKGDKKMFLIRMLLGKCFICKDHNPIKYCRAPCSQCQKDKCTHTARKYDCVVGDNNKMFREFVVYSGDQCYPEYLISYNRV